MRPGTIILSRDDVATLLPMTECIDSTGTALQDVAAAALVYRKALAGGQGQVVNFA